MALSVMMVECEQFIFYVAQVEWSVNKNWIDLVMGQVSVMWALLYVCIFDSKASVMCVYTRTGMDKWVQYPDLIMIK